MNAFSKLGRSELITGIAGILLFIGLLAFPWYHVGFAGIRIGDQTVGAASVNATAVQSDGAFAGVLALIVLIALLAEVAISRLSTVQLPELPISWRAAEMYASIAILVLLIIKFLIHIGNFGWGFYFDILLAIVLIVGAIGLGSQSAARPAQAGVQPQPPPPAV